MTVDTWVLCVPPRLGAPPSLICLSKCRNKRLGIMSQVASCVTKLREHKLVLGVFSPLFLVKHFHHQLCKSVYFLRDDAEVLRMNKTEAELQL